MTLNRQDKNFFIQKIRNDYCTPTESVTELDKLRALDKKVKRPAKVFAWIFGSLAALIMGCGMSLVMTNLAATLGLTDAMIPGIVIGAVGMLMAILTYPIYAKLLKVRKKRYAPEILALSATLIEE